MSWRNALERKKIVIEKPSGISAPYVARFKFLHGSSADSGSTIYLPYKEINKDRIMFCDESGTLQLPTWCEYCPEVNSHTILWESNTLGIFDVKISSNSQYATIYAYLGMLTPVSNTFSVMPIQYDFENQPIWNSTISAKLNDDYFYCYKEYFPEVASYYSSAYYFEKGDISNTLPTTIVACNTIQIPDSKNYDIRMYLGFEGGSWGSGTSCVVSYLVRFDNSILHSSNAFDCNYDFAVKYHEFQKYLEAGSHTVSVEFVSYSLYSYIYFYLDSFSISEQHAANIVSSTLEYNTVQPSNTILNLANYSKVIISKNIFCNPGNYIASLELSNYDSSSYSNVVSIMQNCNPLSIQFLNHNLSTILPAYPTRVAVPERRPPWHPRKEREYRIRIDIDTLTDITSQDATIYIAKSTVGTMIPRNTLYYAQSIFAMNSLTPDWSWSFTGAGSLGYSTLILTPFGDNYYNSYFFPNRNIALYLKCSNSQESSLNISKTFELQSGIYTIYVPFLINITSQSRDDPYKTLNLCFDDSVLYSLRGTDVSRAFLDYGNTFRVILTASGMHTFSMSLFHSGASSNYFAKLNIVDFYIKKHSSCSPTIISEDYPIILYSDLRSRNSINSRFVNTELSCKNFNSSHYVPSSYSGCTIIPIVTDLSHNNTTTKVFLTNTLDTGYKLSLLGYNSDFKDILITLDNQLVRQYIHRVNQADAILWFRYPTQLKPGSHTVKIYYGCSTNRVSDPYSVFDYVFLPHEASYGYELFNLHSGEYGSASISDSSGNVAVKSFLKSSCYTYPWDGVGIKFRTSNPNLGKGTYELASLFESDLYFYYNTSSQCRIYFIIDDNTITAGEHTISYYNDGAYKLNYLSLNGIYKIINNANSIALAMWSGDCLTSSIELQLAYICKVPASEFNTFRLNYSVSIPYYVRDALYTIFVPAIYANSYISNTNLDPIVSSSSIQFVNVVNESTGATIQCAIGTLPSLGLSEFYWSELLPYDSSVSYLITKTTVQPATVPFGRLGITTSEPVQGYWTAEYCKDKNGVISLPDITGKCADIVFNMRPSFTTQSFWNWAGVKSHPDLSGSISHLGSFTGNTIGYFSNYVRLFGNSIVTNEDVLHAEVEGGSFRFTRETFSLSNTFGITATQSYADYWFNAVTYRFYWSSATKKLYKDAYRVTESGVLLVNWDVSGSPIALDPPVKFTGGVIVGKYQRPMESNFSAWIIGTISSQLQPTDRFIIPPGSDRVWCSNEPYGRKLSTLIPIAVFPMVLKSGTLTIADTLSIVFPSMSYGLPAMLFNFILHK